jgi:homoserine O-acetyltransferase
MSLHLESEGDFVAPFTFESGETLELRQHYSTLGEPQRDPTTGLVTNAVLVMHGTTGSGSAFLGPGSRERFALPLFGEGGPLDARTHYIVLPDGIGHGASSRPSDGLRMAFPQYTYDDMVLAQHQLLAEHLEVNHLRLVTGTSMGGMQTWVWGCMFPTFMDALFPLASLPIAIAGVNRMVRKAIVDAIVEDPAFENGDYPSERSTPLLGQKAAVRMMAVRMTSTPLQCTSRQQCSTRQTDTLGLICLCSAEPPGPSLPRLFCCPNAPGSVLYGNICICVAA